MRNALLAGIITGTAFSLAHFGVIQQSVEIPLYIIAIILGGFHWAREGIEELIEEREIGIEILMIGATIGSAVLGMWDEAAFLVFLYGTAEGLEEYAYAKTRHSIRELLDLAPKEARVMKDGKEIAVPAESLAIGDVFIVKPGEAIATDGLPALFGVPISYWATRAVVLLVAAAPCALVMSTPVAIAAGIGKAGKSGVLIKGGIHLENLGKIKAIAFDKTGTLTRGKPIVTDIIAINRNKSDILRLAGSVERNSEHPLARAILKKAEEAGEQSEKAVDFRAMAGYGAIARVGDETVYVGKQGLFEKFGQDIEVMESVENLKNEGKTIILVGTEEKIDGIIAIRDEIKKEAKGVIEKLHGSSIDVLMLTGDNETTARAIARELGIDVVKADLRPEDKISAIIELEKKYGAIAMVGDGINDAPALARATVGMAMGTAGTDAAIEAADIALMADDLGKVLSAINLGKRAKRIIRQNVVFSLVVLGLLIPGALIGLMSVTAAVFFHEASELLAVANGLRVAKV